jgi:outer membrane lipase/esterase
MSKLHQGLFAVALAGLSALSNAGSYSGLYIFGDSLSDAGNISLAVGSDPGQVITGNSYIPDLPYASGQFSNGDVWAKTFANALGFVGASFPSLAGGSDLAFGGARMATDGAGMPPSLAAQVGGLVTAAAGQLPADALYVIEGGGNDARDALLAAAGSATPGSVIADAANAYAQAAGSLVDQLQAAGAHSIIVWNVPNLATAPAVTSLGADAAYLGGLVSSAMSGALAARMAGENGVTVFDVFGLETSFVTDAAAFGLINVTDACGATVDCDPWTSLFWDGIHPTSAGHALLAEHMLAAAVPEPGAMWMAMAGMLLIGWRTRRHA